MHVWSQGMVLNSAFLGMKANDSPNGANIPTQRQDWLPLEVELVYSRRFLVGGGHILRLRQGK